jgi:hypothetical protein
MSKISRRKFNQGVDDVLTFRPFLRFWQTYRTTRLNGFGFLWSITTAMHWKRD